MLEQAKRAKPCEIEEALVALYADTPWSSPARGHKALHHLQAGWIRRAIGAIGRRQQKNPFVSMSPKICALKGLIAKSPGSEPCWSFECIIGWEML